MAARSPLLPRFGMTVGVTGHRAGALPPGAWDRIEIELRRLLGALEAGAARVREQATEFFDAAPPDLRLLSPIASGADQIAARLALDLGWRLDVALPTARADHDTGQAGAEAVGYDHLLGAADRLLELPGRPDDPASFALAGRATVAHADLLVAVWDGLPARGRGGTAEVVELALLRGTPVLHLPTESGPVRVLWSALDPVVVSHGANIERMPVLDEALLERILALLLVPPQAERERQFLRQYLRERPARRRLRIEYPLLMMATGVRRLRRGDISARPGIRAQKDEWQAYVGDCHERHGLRTALGDLERAFCAADTLATHFAQTYRSSHVFNFILAAVGTLIALSGLVSDAPAILLAAAEAVVVAAIILNTIVGSRRCWHQRWLDYRQLAERLRPMRSLKLLAIASPDPPGSIAEPVAHRWLDWYAAALWRQLGIPDGALRAAEVSPLADAIRRRELDPQIAYNRANARVISAFDRRLEALALGLFALALLITFGTVVALLLVPDRLQPYSTELTVLSAALPAVGTAIFGIRVQGDHGALAVRSRGTAALLERIAGDLGATDSLPRAADLVEQAARIMLADLGEWRLVNELHELSLG